MKLIFFGGVLLAAAAGVGIYMGVFHVSSDNSPQQSNVTVTVDKDKLGQAEDKAKEEIKDVSREVKEKAAEMTKKKPTTTTTGN